LLTINLTFKKFNFQKNKEFQKNIQNAVANSFFISSIISIVGALIIYCFLKNILGIFNIKEGIINYANFAAKIWFVSSPFIGLELTIFKYFSKLDFFQKNIIIIISKLIIYYILSIILYFKFQNNCIVYAKPICDIIFLPYYTKICFDLTLKSNK
jgi:Na+-driven multidrug efflux pump